MPQYFLFHLIRNYLVYLVCLPFCCCIYKKTRQGGDRVFRSLSAASGILKEIVEVCK